VNNLNFTTHPTMTVSRSSMSDEGEPFLHLDTHAHDAAEPLPKNESYNKVFLWNHVCIAACCGALIGAAIAALLSKAIRIVPDHTQSDPEPVRPAFLGKLYFTRTKGSLYRMAF
jgi:hypothetical protein